MDESTGIIERPDKALEKPVERTGGFGEGKLLSMAKKGLTTGIQKTKELSGDVYAKVKENMPSFEKQQEATKSSEETIDPVVNNYRNKHIADFRARDGHMVRSLLEQSLDDWFYEKQILHEYEKSVTPPGEVWMCPDFYLPYDRNGNYLGNLPGGIYVEVWGITNDEDYKKTMEKKKKIYDKKKMFRIDIYPAHMKDPSTELPKKFNEIFKDKLKYTDERSQRIIINVEKGNLVKDEIVSDMGFCIRCGEQIKFNVEKPYCSTDFLKWSEFNKTDYIEKNGKCHICGKPNDSSKEKPVCKECYKKHKQLFK